jgi:hypothetical protein
MEEAFWAAGSVAVEFFEGDVGAGGVAVGDFVEGEGEDVGVEIGGGAFGAGLGGVDERIVVAGGAAAACEVSAGGFPAVAGAVEHAVGAVGDVIEGELVAAAHVEGGDELAATDEFDQGVFGEAVVDGELAFALAAFEGVFDDGAGGEARIGGEVIEVGGGRGRGRGGRSGWWGGGFGAGPAPPPRGPGGSVPEVEAVMGGGGCPAGRNTAASFWAVAICEGSMLASSTRRMLLAASWPCSAARLYQA